MSWGKGWEVTLNREIYRQRVVQGRADWLKQTEERQAETQRERYLRKRCECGSGLADGLCTNCWPQ